jgi:hypothetical protein
MGSGAVIYVPSSIKIGSGIQKLIGGIHKHTHGQQRDLISLLCFFFFQNKESRLKTEFWTSSAKSRNARVFLRRRI